MEDVLLYFLIGVFGADVAKNIKNKEIEIPGITIAVLFFCSFAVWNSVRDVC